VADAQVVPRFSARAGRSVENKDQADAAGPARCLARRVSAARTGPPKVLSMIGGRCSRLSADEALPHFHPSRAARQGHEPFRWRFRPLGRNAGDLRGLPSRRPCGDADHVGDVAGVPGCGRVSGRRGEGLARDPTRSSGPRGWGGSVPTAGPARLISGGRTGRCALAMSDSGTVDHLAAGERASPRWISTQQPHRRGQRSPQHRHDLGKPP
jgi:hypothetical protein